MAKSIVKTRVESSEESTPPVEEKVVATEENIDTPKNSEKNALERAKLHLSFLEAELEKLVAHGSAFIGPVRRSAASAGEQLVGSAQNWKPIVIIRNVLNAATEAMNKA